MSTLLDQDAADEAAKKVSAELKQGNRDLQAAIDRRNPLAADVVEAPEPLNAQQMAFQLIRGGADVESVKQFLAMSKEIAAEEARRAFERAVADAKAEIPVITKNRHVGFTSKKEGAAKTDYWHEDFAQIARTVDPILSKHGLSYRHEADQEGATLSVTCILSHREGHSTRTTLKAGNDTSGNKNPIQGVGSTATFLQRYTLKLALGLAASRDDDGKAGGDDLMSDDQIEALKDQLEAAAQATGSEYADWLDLFLDVMQVDNLRELAAKDFERSKQAIEAAKVARAKK